jgi:hypothetical protein
MPVTWIDKELNVELAHVVILERIQYVSDEDFEELERAREAERENPLNVDGFAFCLDLSMCDASPPPPPLPPQLWNLVRQRDATREAAVQLYQCGGERVSRALLPTAPPPVAACGEVRMTRGERMRALSCMGRAMVMLKLARGAGMPGALGYADAQKATTAMMKRDAAARAPPFHPCHPFPFSGSAEHTAPDVLLSDNRLTVTRTTDFDAGVMSGAWARSERGVAAGCGVVRWAVKLGQEGERVPNRSFGLEFSVGVAGDEFSGYSDPFPGQSWYYCALCMVADGQTQGAIFNSPSFTTGDVVTVELERAPGVDGVLRVRVAGKIARELRGLPRDGVLYPIVGLRKQQSITMVALP